MPYLPPAQGSPHENKLLLIILDWCPLPAIPPSVRNLECWVDSGDARRVDQRAVLAVDFCRGYADTHGRGTGRACLHGGNLAMSFAQAQGKLAQTRARARDGCFAHPFGHNFSTRHPFDYVRDIEL